MRINWPKIAIFTMTLTILIGCAGNSMSGAAESANQSAAEAGSPYRWEHTKTGNFEVLTKTIIGTEAETTADAELAEFTRAQIALISDEKPISPEQEPSQVRIVSASDTGTEEVWVYELDEGTQAYVVNYTTSAQGGTDVTIAGPW